MSDQHCNEATTWTCRQTALSQEQRIIQSVDEASPSVSPTRTLPAIDPVHPFVPGMVAHYLTHQDLPITRELAVLFVDLANSTRILSRQPPTHALTLIQHFTELVTDIAVAHCGDVKDYEGDGALLYFASIAHATRAALAMRTAFAVLHTRDGQVIQARFSLNVGEVTIGVIGSASRRSVALIGSTVHLAARLLKHVAPNGIIAPKTVVDRLQQEAPALARDFRLQGTCLTIRDFEEQCVTAYHLPSESVESRVQRVEGTAQQRTEPGQSLARCCPPTPGAGHPMPEAFFRPEGEYWTLVFQGTVARIKDTRGMHHLAYLLQHPDQEFSALALAADTPDFDANPLSAARLLSETRDPAAATVHLAGFTDAGEVLDPQARAAYRQRLTELHAELEEAREFHNLGRVENLQDEIEFVMQELVGAVGLRGRARKSASPQERARVNVTRAIRTAIIRVAEALPALGHYLTQTIKTGYGCAYTPTPTTELHWQF
ncbi:MAG: adenylate/guanylate cyclase domain-containing protein [Deltaproteobacteria bacterium]|nr:adenylate/guanylate cyclase domain-containing protein [Deltaproteobacteria bacterium]